MEEIDFSYISVYQIKPAKKVDIKPSDIVGGQLKINKKIKSIFLSSFNGRLTKGLKLQPFHFVFEGDKRKNPMREELINLFSIGSNKKDAITRNLAMKLSKLIDERTKELLFTFAFGKTNKFKRIAMWVYPHAVPIQLNARGNALSVKEIENAFSKQSTLRKACFFEVPNKISRNDLLMGQLVDSSAGRTKSVTDYWSGKFLEGSVELLPARGTNQVITGLKAAQTKAKTPEEKNSVKAVFYSLLSTNKQDATIGEIGNLLVGSAKTAYLSKIPKTIETNARFKVDFDTLKSKIKSKMFVLKNGIEVHFPNDSNIDPDDFIKTEGKVRKINIFEEIDEEYFK